MSETSKYRSLTSLHCRDLNGVPLTVLDVASQGDPVVPWAWQLDLPEAEFHHYSGGQTRKNRGIQLSGHADKLPVDDQSLDVVYASHVLEDFKRDDWPKILSEWKRVLKINGKLIILVPEVTLWNYAIQVLGQCPNCSHATPEPHVGEITKYATPLGLKTIEERLTECHPHDYTIIYVGQRV